MVEGRGNVRMRKALVAGGTGLVGGEILKKLLADGDYSEVHSLVRRPTGRSHPKLTEIIVEFDNLDKIQLPSVDDVFCALGSTIKKAGSREAFYTVDHDYVAGLARTAVRCGAKQFMVVSSIMADPGAKNFYLRVKGEMEQSVRQDGPPTILIFRPATLEGDRIEKRPGEKVAIVIMKAIGFLLVGRLKKYRIINAETVARVMISAAKANFGSLRVFESDEIAEYPV